MPDKVVDAQGNPIAKGSGENTQSATSTETEMPEWAKKLDAKVDEALGQARAAQSGGDQLKAGQLNLQNKIEQAESTFAEAAQYLGKYSDPAEAERNWFIDQQMKQSRELNQGNDPNAQQNINTLAGAGSGAELVDPELLKTQYGVDPQSAEYLEQVKTGKVGFEAALAVLSARQVANLEGAATGASGGAGGSTTSETTQQQVLRDQYNAELDDAQKANRGVLHPNSLYTIQVKYAQLGLKDLV